MPGSWSDVRAELLRLERDPAGPLRRFPNPREDIARTPPFHLRLAAWADVVAADLHRRFGDTVDLTVGVLHYPDRSVTDRWDAGREWRGAPGIKGAGLSVRLMPLTVVSGHWGRSIFLVHNGSDVPVTLRTNGGLTAVVTDPVTGDVVGRRAGFRTLELVRFHHQPGRDSSHPGRYRHRQRRSGARVRGSCGCLDGPGSVAPGRRAAARDAPTTGHGHRPEPPVG